MIRFNIKGMIAQKEIREGRRVTLAEVADAVGVHRVTLSKMANSIGNMGKIKAERIEKLCRYLNCSPSDLMIILPDPPADDKPAGKKKAKAKTKKTPGGEKPQGDK